METGSTEEIYKLLAEEEFEAAEALCRDLLEREEQRHVFLTVLGEIYIAQGRSIEAQLFFERALEYEPEYEHAASQLDFIDSLISLIKLPASHLIEKFNDGLLDHKSLIILYRMLRETERKIELIDGLKHGAQAKTTNWQTLWFFAREAKEFDHSEAVDTFCKLISELNPGFIYASELPRHVRGFYSYADYDEHIELFFEQNNPSYKTFVEIGSFDGQLHSQVRRLYESFRWSGVCIEPNPDNYRRTQRLYEGTGVLCSNLFISDYEDNAKEGITVKTLGTALNELKIADIDFLCINTSRNVLPILRGYDFSKSGPSLIACKTGKNRNAIDAYLTKKNYLLHLEADKYRFYRKQQPTQDSAIHTNEFKTRSMISSGVQMNLVCLMLLEAPQPYLEIVLRAINLLAGKTIVLTTCEDESFLDSLFSLKSNGLISSLIHSQESSRQKNKNMLLSHGRQVSGTHFLVIEPNEILSSNLLSQQALLSSIAELNPGESISLKKIFLWNGLHKYFEYPAGQNEKKCIVAFADDGISAFDESGSEKARIPAGLKGRKFFIDESNYALIDLRYANLENMLIYHAWTQCKEITAMEEPNAASVIEKVGLLPDVSRLTLLETHPTWLIGYKFLNEKELEKTDDWRIRKIYRWFNQYGLAFFRDLDIWQVNWKSYLPLATSTPELKHPEANSFTRIEPDGRNPMMDAEEAIRNHDLDFAEQLLAEILYDAPRNIEALNNLAIIKIMTEEYKAAEEILTQILLISPGDETALENLSQLQKMAKL